MINYGCIGEALFLKFTGDGTRSICTTADKLVCDFIDAHQNSPTVFFDLRGCGWVDSTFAGWMVGVQKRLNKAGPGGALRLVGWSDECRESLARMSLCRLFQQKPVEAPLHCRQLECPTDEPPDRAAIELMAAAHRELAELDENNRRVFEPIAIMLEEQLGQLPN